jgi:hypothetical protein
MSVVYRNYGICIRHDGSSFSHILSFLAQMQLMPRCSLDFAVSCGQQAPAGITRERSL